jgi:hypothetical protein
MRATRFAWVFALGLVPAQAAPTPEPEAAVVWTIDNCSKIGGREVEILGAPQPVQTELGLAVRFDGTQDALWVGENPLAGRNRFTIQLLFKPERDGLAEQRFLHIEELGSPHRIMMETRLTPEGQWYLDSHLNNGRPGSSHTLIDPQALHPSERWHWLALTFDGERVRHYVDGVQQGEGAFLFEPLGPGRVSLGVRFNKRYWFKGLMRELRFHGSALPPAELERAAQAEAGAGVTPGTQRGTP